MKIGVKDRMLEVLKKEEGPITPQMLMKKANIIKKDVFFHFLDQLQANGSIIVTKEQLIKMGTAFKKIEAKVISLSKNFAFARPTENGQDDVFIPGSELHGACIGDTVILKDLIQSDRGMKASISSIEEKGKRQCTGLFTEEEGKFVVIPDIAIRYPLLVLNNKEVQAKPGDKVQIELKNDSYGRLDAKIIKVYGTADSAKICSDAILEQNEIRVEFPEDILKEARKISSSLITEADIKGRLDLRDLPICTIDSADAKDLDDAISIEKRGDSYLLGIHIADVSYYVKPGTSMDEEAQMRGTSVYLPGRVIPMLPKEISNGVCSLNAKEDKLTFSAMIELNAKGEIVTYSFHKSVIHSKVRGVYSEVNQIFSGEADENILQKYAPVMHSLLAAKELAMILKQLSRSKGTIEIESREPAFVLDENGVCIDIKPRHTGESEEMIEQLMVTANQAAAKLGEEKKMPFVYRVHENPNPSRVEELADLVVALGLNSQPIRKKNVVTGDFAAIMKQAEGTPAQKILSYQILRTMEKARYAVNSLGHFGLALEYYCHFTSPIRRYPDTATHRIIGKYLTEKNEMTLQKEFHKYVEEVSINSSKAEIRALISERTSNDCYMAEFMRSHIGESFKGTISGVTMRGIFVTLENSVEGFVSIHTFEGADYVYDGSISQLDIKSGKKLTIGQEIRIKVAGASVPNRRIDFIPDPT